MYTVFGGQEMVECIDSGQYITISGEISSESYSMLYKHVDTLFFV